MTLLPCHSLCQRGVDTESTLRVPSLRGRLGSALRSLRGKVVKEPCPQELPLGGATGPCPGCQWTQTLYHTGRAGSWRGGQIGSASG